MCLIVQLVVETVTFLNNVDIIMFAVGYGKYRAGKCGQPWGRPMSSSGRSEKLYVRDILLIYIVF